MYKGSTDPQYMEREAFPEVMASALNAEKAGASTGIVWRWEV